MREVLEFPAIDVDWEKIKCYEFLIYDSMDKNDWRFDPEQVHAVNRRKTILNELDGFSLIVPAEDAEEAQQKVSDIVGDQKYYIAEFAGEIEGETIRRRKLHRYINGKK